MRLPPLSFSIAALLSLAPRSEAVLDTNRDLLGDVWQARFAAGAFAPHVDSDGDGFSNLEESILGTDPRNPASRLAHEVRALPDGSL